MPKLCFRPQTKRTAKYHFLELPDSGITMSRHHNVYRGYKYKPNYDRNDGLTGVVYILHNEAMRAGVYKIGQSTRSGHARANDLNRTVGTETPKLFKCIFEVHTVDCGRAEKAVHLRLKAYRMTSQEYFDVDLELAKMVVIEECTKQVLSRPPEPVVAPPASCTGSEHHTPHVDKSSLCGSDCDPTVQIFWRIFLLGHCCNLPDTLLARQDQNSTFRTLRPKSRKQFDTATELFTVRIEGGQSNFTCGIPISVSNTVRHEFSNSCYRLRKQAHIWRSWAAIKKGSS